MSDADVNVLCNCLHFMMLDLDGHDCWCLCVTQCLYCVMQAFSGHAAVVNVSRNACIL